MLSLLSPFHFESSYRVPKSPLEVKARKTAPTFAFPRARFVSGFRYVERKPRFSSLDSFRAPFGRSRHLCLTDRPNDFLEGVIGDLNDLIVGPVLDRVRNENARGLESQGFRLCLRGLNELAAGDVCARNTAAFQVGDVMQTA